MKSMLEPFEPAAWVGRNNVAYFPDEPTGPRYVTRILTGPPDAPVNHLSYDMAVMHLGSTCPDEVLAVMAANVAHTFRMTPEAVLRDVKSWRATNGDANDAPKPAPDDSGGNRGVPHDNVRSLFPGRVADVVEREGIPPPGER